MCRYRRYDLSAGGTWSVRWTVAASTSTVGCRGLAARKQDDGRVAIAASSAASTANVISWFVDDGGATAPSPNTVATAPTNTLFRGVAFQPAR